MGDTRLHALDLAWLEMEGDGPPIAIGTVAVAEGPVPDDREVVDLLIDRLPRMPALHALLDDGGVGIRRPAWHPAPGAPDVAAHVHRIAVGDAGPRGSGADRLDAAVSRIMEVRMPRDRPLWDAWVVDGLGAGRWALVWRVHHAISDGVGAVFLLGHGFDLAPGGGRTLADAVVDAQRPADRPTDRSARAAAPAPAPPSPLQQVGGAVRSVAAHLRPAVASLVPHAPGPLTAPVGDRRRWVSAQVPLAEVKAARHRFGATVNDVVLAAVAGGFRTLLLHRGLEVEDRVVRNLVPVSVRGAGEDGVGNHISALLCHLPVGEADPAERIRRVRAGVGDGRAVGEPVGASLLLGAMDRALPAAVQDVAVSTLGRTVPAWFFDTLTTNVPGPQYPVFLAGRRVVAMHPIIPVAGHTAITTGIFSYDGMLDVGVTGDGESAADVDVLARGIRDAVAELAAAGPGSAPR